MTSPTQLIEDGTVLYNKGDVEGFCHLYSEDVLLTTPDGTFEGRSSVLPYVTALRSAFPDVEVKLGRHAEDGDTYLGEFSMTGTNTGPLVAPDGSEIPPTGKAVVLNGSEVAVVANGKIVQHDMLWDNLSFLGQQGLVPPS